MLTSLLAISIGCGGKEQANNPGTPNKAAIKASFNEKVSDSNKQVVADAATPDTATENQNLLTDQEIKNIIWQAEKTAVDTLNLAIKELVEGSTKPPFQSLKPTLLEHYPPEIVGNLEVFYNSNCEGWTNLVGIFPFYHPGAFDNPDVTFAVSERTKDRISVQVQDASSVMQMELGETFKATYVLENINGNWLITEM